ncbi:hypothetical protein VNI00_000368 [Paramarasmius palmivorus]|uniref:Uncharacterized protein n=1 Tax=Paramarasmius palmivorus TaxID=297713 RepID=A0AAW0EGD5_9AGAR
MSFEITEDILQKASEIEVWDSSGIKIKFGSIFATQKTIVVFIPSSSYMANPDILRVIRTLLLRGKNYVVQLAGVPTLALQEAGTEIVLVGCGEWQGIKFYAEKTGFKGRMYAEPSRELYHALGMNIETLALTPAGQEKRSYVSGTIAGNVIKGTLDFLKNPTLIGKQGNVSQIGGDFVFGPGNKCSFAHLMQHTEDHVEVAELMKHAGVHY